MQIRVLMHAGERRALFCFALLPTTEVFSLSRESRLSFFLAFGSRECVWSPFPCMSVSNSEIRSFILDAADEYMPVRVPLCLVYRFPVSHVYPCRLP